MFTIRKEQLTVFNELFLEKFINKSTIHLCNNFPDWSDEKDDAEIEKFIYKIIDYGNKLQISKEFNLLRLMHYFVEYKLNFPLNYELENYLKENDLDEDQRVESLYLFLASKRYELKTIILDTDSYIIKSHRDNTWVKRAPKIRRI